jgi:hypothetical protein
MVVDQSYGNSECGRLRSRKTPQFAGIRGLVKFLRFPTNGLVPGGGIRFDGPAFQSSFQSERGVGQVWQMVGQRRRSPAAKTASFIRIFSVPSRAVTHVEPSAQRTRTDCFRQERRQQVAWAFPSPSEQVALHA